VVAMLRGWFFAGVVAIASLLSACSSTSKSSSATGAAAAQCNAVADKYCAKAAPCSGISVSDCVAGFNDAIKQNYGSDCSGADKVGTSYDACMTELDSMACGDSLPADCNGVILFYQ
jgi:hypothetical protein